MRVKEHYDNHLSHFYSWMAGNFEDKMYSFQMFLKENEIFPIKSKVAIDLGAGHGIQSLALVRMGFDVTAVDFNKKLLNELKSNDKDDSVIAIQDDICKILEFRNLKPELIVCCGDTITHLDNKKAIEKLIADCKHTLIKNGKLILSFRDYSTELINEQKFIPVRSDNERILTCVLEYGKLTVTDLLHEKSEQGWSQKVSSYEKVRISVDEITELLEKNGMTITFNDKIEGLNTIIAE